MNLKSRFKQSINPTEGLCKSGKKIVGTKAINKFNLQTCFKFDGAWPPGIYRQENSTLTFTRGESPTNWELNTW